MSIILTGNDHLALQNRVKQLIQDLSVTKENLLIIETKILGIKEAKEWQEWLNLSPGTKFYKLLVIKNANLLTPEAQNSLLKTLEEPPTNTQIVLETNNLDLLLPTVISRCTVEEYTLLENVVVPIVLPEFLESKNLPLAFSWAEKEFANRELAINWINQGLFTLHSNILQPKTALHVRLLLESKHYLQANCNLRLVMENLVLKW